MPAYTRQYTQDVGWENEPSTATPINAANLNKMDDAIGAIDAELGTLFGNGIIDRNSFATVAQAGLVKPDGRTITVDSDGEIHAVGGSGGASALDDLTDTDITDPATGEVLQYDDVSGKWKNEELPEVPIATTSVAGKVKPDGTTITVDNDGTIHGSSPTLAGLTDTAITTPADGDILRYNSESSKWENEELAEPDGMAKTRFTVSSSGWSASANASGYYTYSLALGTSVNVAYSPTIYLAGASDSTFPTDAERAQYNRLDEAALTAADTVTLYAKTKPTSTFYVFAEIVSAGGAGGGKRDLDFVASLEVTYSDMYFDSGNNRYRNATKSLSDANKAILQAAPSIVVELGFKTKYGKTYTTATLNISDYQNGWASCFVDYALNVCEYMSEDTPFKLLFIVNAGMYAVLPTGSSDVVAFAKFYIPR